MAYVQLVRRSFPTLHRRLLELTVFSGVMTKPDTLPSGATKSRELWLDVIEGRRFHLKHGYYCTRQPDDEERSKNITADQAREAEMRFFKSTTPWSRSKEPHRFGTNQLVLNLSKLLTQIIYDTYVDVGSSGTHTDPHVLVCRRCAGKLPVNSKLVWTVSTNYRQPSRAIRRPMCSTL